MHYSIKALLLAGLLAGGPLAAVAQSAPDPARISYSEEELNEPFAEAKVEKAYSRLTRLQIEENRLWKLGLNDFGGSGNTTPYYDRYGVYLIYEHKLMPAWSVLGELSPELLRYRSTPFADLRTGASVRTQLAGRYYYNLIQRIRKGKSASNFSANYLSVGLGAGFGRNSPETPYTTVNQAQAVRLAGAVLYGLQRRLGRYGFVDFNFGVPVPLVPEREPTNGININIIVNLRIGLALGQ